MSVRVIVPEPITKVEGPDLSVTVSDTFNTFPEGNVIEALIIESVIDVVPKQVIVPHLKVDFAIVPLPAIFTKAAVGTTIKEFVSSENLKSVVLETDRYPLMYLAFIEFASLTVNFHGPYNFKSQASIVYELVP